MRCAAAQGGCLMRFWSQVMALVRLGVLAGAFGLSGCLAGQPGPATCHAVTGELPFVQGPRSSDFYARETARWQAELAKGIAGPQKAEASLYLAALALSADNPGQDYAAALGHMTAALVAQPELRSKPALASWLELLRHYDDLGRQSRREISALESTAARLQEQNAGQRQELIHMRETLERLKRVDLSVERKRRALR